MSLLSSITTKEKAALTFSFSPLSSTCHHAILVSLSKESNSCTCIKVLKDTPLTNLVEQLRSDSAELAAYTGGTSKCHVISSKPHHQAEL